LSLISFVFNTVKKGKVANERMLLLQAIPAKSNTILKGDIEAVNY